MSRPLSVSRSGRPGWRSDRNDAPVKGEIIRSSALTSRSAWSS